MVCLHFVHSYYCYILHLLIVIYVLLALAQSPPNQHQMFSPLLQISWCTASFPVLLLFSLDLSQLSTRSFVCFSIISRSRAHSSLTQPVVIAAAESGSERQRHARRQRTISMRVDDWLRCSWVGGGSIGWWLRFGWWRGKQGIAQLHLCICASAKTIFVLES